jgi:hypothetical protein
MTNSYCILTKGEVLMIDDQNQKYLFNNQGALIMDYFNIGKLILHATTNIKLIKIDK